MKIGNKGTLDGIEHTLIQRTMKGFGSYIKDNFFPYHKLQRLDST